MINEEYKTYHEAYVSNNTGTTNEECVILLSTIPFSTFVSSWVSSYFSETLQPLLEFFVIILPAILNSTVLSESNYLIFLNFFLFSTVIFIIHFDKNKLTTLLSTEIKDRKGFVTIYRAGTNFFSALCILAVDFTVFPKRLAKTESFGFGFMDLGVGFFICSNGLVEKQKAVKTERFKLIKSVSVLLLLGIMRVLSVKSLNYHEHVAEYGVHWNFFFTLALCHIISNIVKSITQDISPMWLSLIIGIIHQILLMLGLQNWVLLDSPRDSFISANKEGLTSNLGYVSLYFAACSLGKLIRTNNLTYRNLLVKLILVSVFAWLGMVLSYKMFGVSRRLVNIGYILWVLALTSTELTLFLLIQLGICSLNNEKRIKNLKTVPCLLDSINANALFYFLCANLLTGLINSILRTLFMAKTISFIIITSYMLVLSGLSYLLYLKKIFFKL